MSVIPRTRESSTTCQLGQTYHVHVTASERAWTLESIERDNPKWWDLFDDLA